MNKRVLVILAFAGAAGCATSPKCETSEGSQTVFSGPSGCEVRIRQVSIASKMDLPKAVRASDLTTWRLDWSDSKFQNGRIESGHFLLVPLEKANP